MQWRRWYWEGKEREVSWSSGWATATATAQLDDLCIFLFVFHPDNKETCRHSYAGMCLCLCPFLRHRLWMRVNHVCVTAQHESVNSPPDHQQLTLAASQLYRYTNTERNKNIHIHRYNCKQKTFRWEIRKQVRNSGTNIERGKNIRHKKQ